MLVRQKWNLEQDLIIIKVHTRPIENKRKKKKNNKKEKKRKKKKLSLRRLGRNQNITRLENKCLIFNILI